jgi:hypothetical protein
MAKEVESVIKNLATKKRAGLPGFTGDFHQIFKELISLLLQCLQKN